MNMQPTKLDVFQSKQRLQIEWPDGVVHELPFFGLRKNCPCVACRGGHEKMGQFELELFFVEPTGLMAELRMKALKAVGRHAIRITWSDGHNDGMYRHEDLYEWGDFVSRRVKNTKS